MKPIISLFTFLAALAISVTTFSQNRSGIDSTGLPGDNFSLQGALAMFQKASSPEDFEKRLNAQDNHVNNLDLNGDGDIDYVRVVDKTEKGVHALVLQAIISEKESQDVAVIEVEKTGDETAVLQIVGDEEIYGEQVIVEPGAGEEADAFINSPNIEVIAHGPNPGEFSVNRGVIINVWLWPSVRFVYAPAYRPWISPWRWRHYPGWWKPWKPLKWHVWRPFHRPYHAHYAVVHTHRVVHAHRVYTPHRVTSVTVRTRHSAAVGHYKVTRTKTKVSGPRGHGAVKTKTTVNGPGGKSRTKTAVRRR